jgi:hypothetical protein
VVDLWIDRGTFIGDNLGTSIFAKTGKGVVVNGSVRDLSGILEIEGFHGFVRDFHPTALADTTLVGINVPIRIGGVTVRPGDVVLSDPEGLTFIPPHLAEKVATSSEDVRFRDDWGHEMMRQGKYTPGQVDASGRGMEAEGNGHGWPRGRRSLSGPRPPRPEFGAGPGDLAGTCRGSAPSPSNADDRGRTKTEFPAEGVVCRPSDEHNRRRET